MRDYYRALIAAALIVWFGTPAIAQNNAADPIYWSYKEINFPVPLDKINAMNPRPSRLRFCVAPDKGNWRTIAEKALNDLELLDPDRNRRGFRYTCPMDGEYDFALQYIFADGTADPRDGDLRPQYRVVFDTRPPVVRVAPLGTMGLSWSVEDDYLRADGVTLEARWAGDDKWSAITTRPLRAKDSFTFRDISRTRPIDVRIIGKDRGGLETVSRILALPSAVPGAGLQDNVDTGFGNPPYNEPGTGAPSIDYVNSQSLTVESRLSRVTRSGVKNSQLWVNDGKTGWKLATTDPQNITAADKDPLIKMKYQAPKDGRYGFIVIPINGAGGKQDDPRPDDPAQFLIEVDTEKPFVKIKNHRVAPGGVNGPRVEIEWEATDKNLWREPIVLEYSEDRTASKWKEIHAGKLANTGRYVWEVEDKNLWKFYLRIAALDMASNRGEHVYEKEVIIDLETPKAIIEKVQGGSSKAYETEKPASSSPAPSPSPAESAPQPKKPLPPVGSSPPSSSSPATNPIGPNVPKLPEKTEKKGN
jgi:hypothetical protein